MEEMDVYHSTINSFSKHPNRAVIPLNRSEVPSVVGDARGVASTEGMDYSASSGDGIGAIKGAPDSASLVCRTIMPSRTIRAVGSIPNATAAESKMAPSMLVRAMLGV